LDDTGVGVLDAVTGAPGWHVDLATQVSRPTVEDGQVYVGASDGTVRALDLGTGAETWRWEGPSGIAVRVDVVLDGVLYVSTFDGRLVLVDRSSGAEICTFRTLAPRLAPPIVTEKATYVSNTVQDDGARTGQVASIDGRTCEPHWKFVTPSGDQALAGVAADGVLYVGTKRDGLYALRDAGDGYEQVWRQPELLGLDQPPPLVDGLLYSLGNDGPLAAVRATDGSIAWSVDVGMGAIGGPILSGGEAFVTGDAGGRTAVEAFADRDVLANLPRAAEASPSPTPSPASRQPFTVVKTFDATTTTVAMPLAMAAGPDGLLYVIDTKPSLVVIDPKTGKAVRTWGRLGPADGEFDFRRPDVENVGIGFVAVAGNEVIVSDSTNNRFQVFDLRGKFLRKFGRQGAGVGQFETPGNVLPAADGSLYIDDWGSGALTKVGPSGDVAWRVGGSDAPSALSGIYRYSLLPDGRPLGSPDAGGQAVLLDPATGSVIGRWGPADLGADAEISTDPQGHVYLFQYVPQAMLVLDTSGRELGRLDYEEAPPLPAGQYEMPWGSHFWPPPVFPGDGYGYSFTRAGLVRIEIDLP
jgi:outer membrane protein assembly factor BamB